MHICPIRNNFNPNYSKINFTSKVVEVQRGAATPELKKQVDLFEESDGRNAVRLGDGLSAIAYRITGTDCVIKASKQGKAKRINGDFSKEAESLELIPPTVTNAQRLICNVRTEEDNWYLISTFVDGEIPDGVNVKWNRKNLSSLLDTLGKLDAANVYHGDVSRANCLITKNDKVNLLDFQYAEKFEFKGDEAHKLNSEKYKTPYFIAPSNAQMFEESTFGTYLTQIDPHESDGLFKTYLEEKSKYHQTRAEAFEEQGARPEIVEYEKLMAKYLENPSPELIDLQAEKMHIYALHRELFSAMDGYSNTFSTVSYYLEAISKSNAMAKHAARLAGNTADPDLRKLYEYEQKNALFWRSAMKNELDGRHGNSSVFKWILRNAKQEPYNDADDISAKIVKTSTSIHHEVPNIRNILTDGTYSFKIKKARKDGITDQMTEKIDDLRRTNTFYVTKKSPVYNDILEFHKMKNSIMWDIKCANAAYSEGNQFSSIYFSLNALYKSVNAHKQALNYSEDTRMSYDTKCRMHDEAEFFEWYSKELEGLNESLYGKLFSEAAEENQ